MKCKECNYMVNPNKNGKIESCIFCKIRGIYVLRKVSCKMVDDNNHVTKLGAITAMEVII